MSIRADVSRYKPGWCDAGCSGFEFCIKEIEDNQNLVRLLYKCSNHQKTNKKPKRTKKTTKQTKNQKALHAVLVFI